ncbi:PAS domain S-box protein [Halonotius sp. F2-221B]|uniref:PAS domain S-box protein n=1 Tax=Halonotius sp. F2-221B TaxID=2731620 RepID=UPI00398AEFDB
MTTPADAPITMLAVGVQRAVIASVEDSEAAGRVETAADADAALATLADYRPDCVLVGVPRPAEAATTFIERIRTQHSTLPVICVVSAPGESVVQAVLAAGATDYVAAGDGGPATAVLLNRIQNAVGADRAQRVAAQQEQTLNHFFEESPLGAVQWDESFRFERLNKRAEAMLGYTEAELTGKSWEHIVAEEDQEHVSAAVENLLSADGGIHVVNKNVHKDGEVRIYKWHNRAVTDPDGAVRSIFSMFHDVTDSVERKAELEQNETIIEALTDGIYVLDADGRFTFVNDEFVELVGYDRETIIGSTSALLKDAAAIERAEEHLGRLLSSEGPETVVFEIPIQRADGDTLLCEDQMAVLPYEGDSFVGSVGTLRDITEQRQREHRFQALIEETNHIISVVDTDGRFQYQSPSIERILGHPPAETIGEIAWEYIHPDDSDEVKTAFNSWVATGQPTLEPIEYRARHADGSWRWMEASGRAHTDTPGVEGYLINSQEITARKERQQQLALFDRVLRHNLRNDMNVIRGSADTIHEKGAEDVTWLAGKIREMCDKLLATTEKQREITQLLREPPTQSEIDLQPILEEVESKFESTYPEATIQIDGVATPRLQVGDKFVYALEELMTNAIIHNDGEEPRVAVTVEQAAEQVQITVADNGPRIPEMERDVIQHPESRSPLYHGSGLGLWLVKLIVSRSGGTVQFVETGQVGNTIAVTIPQTGRR